MRLQFMPFIAISTNYTVIYFMRNCSNGQLSLLQPLISNLIKELELKPSLDYSLLGGDFGSVLSLYYASKYGLCSQGQADMLLDKVFSGLNTTHLIPTYCNGIAGLCIGLCKLEEMGFIEDAYASTLKYKEYLSNVLSNYKEKTLDFLHGSIGIAMYFLLYKGDEKCITETEEMIKFLYNNRITHKDGGIYWRFPDRHNQLIENLSLSHGISAVAMYLTKALKVIKTEEIKDMTVSLLNGIGLYLRSNLISPDKYGSYTPMLPSSYRSRLGWCYGDVGTSIALRYISEITEDPECARLSYEIAKYAATNRRDLKLNYIYDACICHGSAGLIVFFNNCYDHYKDNVFKDASEYWTKVTYRMAKPYGGIKRFDYFYSPHDARYHSINILEGDAGVALALLNEDRLLNNILLLNNEI